MTNFNSSIPPMSELLTESKNPYRWGNRNRNSDKKVEYCLIPMEDSKYVVYVARNPADPSEYLYVDIFPYPLNPHETFLQERFENREVPAFATIEVLTKAERRPYQHLVSRGYVGYSYQTEDRTEMRIAGEYCNYDQNFIRSYKADIHAIEHHFFYIDVRVTAESGESAILTLDLGKPPKGVVDIETDTQTVNMFGTDVTYPYNWDSFIKRPYSYGSYSREQFAAPQFKAGLEAAWGAYLKRICVNPAARDMTAVKALETKKTIAPNLARLEAEEPILWKFFAWCHDGKTKDKTSNNKLIAAMLTLVGEDYVALRDELRRVMLNYFNLPNGNYRGSDSRDVCLSFVGAKDKIEDAKAKAQWQFAKSARNQAEVIGISPTKHPLLLAAIESNQITMSLFHEAGKEDNLINVEFDLWEKALARPGWSEVLLKIASNAGSRTTYSKRVTSYLAYLFKLEKYLDRTAPRAKKAKWKTMPKFVSSQWELEMTDEATEEGTTKRRSAMTPVADNDTGVVTVPYVAMAVSGIRTTWCYSEIFFVAEEGAEDPVFRAGGVYQADFEEKLNGRDDYGLCFFTLTGSDQNTGYPTFLIIFERTTKHGTRVHFHRVHPSRMRGPNGTQTPPNRMVAECYRYMAGNIRAEEIAHQQGDLLLQVADGPGKSIDAPVNVFGFENHSFVPLEVDGVAKTVQLVRSTAKTRGNLLGWLHAPTGMRMPHPEHEPIEDIPPGWYALNRCRSYENNPSGVWSLNID